MFIAGVFAIREVDKGERLRERERERHIYTQRDSERETLRERD